MEGRVMERHLDGGELVRYLDGEGPAEERERGREHLARCAACAAELDLLRHESRRVSGWLRAYDASGGAGAAGGARNGSRTGGARTAGMRTRADGPGTWTGRERPGTGRRGERPSGVRALPSWLKAAAAVLLIAAPAVAVPGIRSWVADRLPGAAEDAPAAMEVPAADHQLIRFVPAAGTFTVRFDAREAEGTLVLGRVDGAVDGAPADEAVLRVEGPAEPVVSSGLLRIRNGATKAGRYSLRVPVGTTAVRVVVAGEVLVVEGEALERGAVVRLAAVGR